FFDHLASLKVALGGMPGKYMATSDHPIAFLTFNPPRESGYPTFVDWRLGQPGGKRGLCRCLFVSL
ncbi:hypothetical protein OD785_35785, partial [Pseudomonas aeruginosa]